MFKILGCIFIILSTTFIGFYKSFGLYNRKAFLCSFILFLNSLSTAIRYSCDDIEVLISMCDDDFAQIINKSIVQNDFSLPKKWIEGINSIPKTYSLTHKDRQMMIDFGKKLGTTDVEGQLKHIDMYLNIALSQQENAENEINSKSKLYQVLGFFVGFSFSLLII